MTYRNALNYGIVLLGSVLIHHALLAQGFGRPLTMQGVDAVTPHSASSRGAGGILFGNQSDISIMFSNPTALRSLQDVQFSVGGLNASTDAAQTQQYAPLKYYSNFSLFMEGLSRNIPDPVYDTSVTTYTAADTVQRPFDTIEPNWTSSRSRTIPGEAFLAAPVSVGGTKISVGLGTVEYANLDWHFQNNNVLSPSILTPNPYAPTRPPNDADSSSFPVQWYQYSQVREGTIRGYGASIALTLFEHFDIGVSGLLLQGSADDVESRIERGRLRLYQNYFRAESVYYRVSEIGTSEFSGEEFSVGASYRGESVTAGFLMKLPTRITRTYKKTVRIDSTGMSHSGSVNGTDDIAIPIRSTVALAISVRKNLTFAFEYELRPYASAEYTASNGTVTKPWMSANVAHVGLLFEPVEWMTVRAGVRQQAEIFQPEGNPNIGEPVGYTIYAGGVGFTYSALRLNIAYEYSNMKFVDMWAGAVSINTKRSHTFVADVAYAIPWGLNF